MNIRNKICCLAVYFNERFSNDRIKKREKREKRGKREKKEDEEEEEEEEENIIYKRVV